MTRWFDALPIHRKLVAMALLVTTAALILATSGLAIFDVWRYRRTALDDTTSLAQVIAENTAAAVMFQDPDAARDTLGAIRVRPTIRRACLYVPDGTLFAGVGQRPDLECPSARPTRTSWLVVPGTASVTRNLRTVGTVYVERDLSEIGARLVVTALIGLVMLLASGALAFAIASRLNRRISTPIVQLAQAARTLDPEAQVQALPSITAGHDEVGDLVRAFTEMLRRVRDANARLLESNDLLRARETEREQLLVRERQAGRLKDEFLAAVSHELRTPLNAILGWVQILTATTASEQITTKAIASIARNAKAQTRVIEDLVDVSRIVTGKLNLRFDPVDLKEAIEAAADVIRPAAQAKNVGLEIHLPADVCLVNGDRDRLQQVVWNLLSNSVKFTPDGGSVIVTLRAVDSAYQIDVTDTGIGIAADFLLHVFDRFRQADGSMTRQHGGLGLGLAIVKELTERHGGSATVSSAGADLGSTFSVRLPQLAGLNVPDAPAVLPIDEPRQLTGVRVLAVDDNPDALDLLAAALTNSGANVRVASSGAEALREWDRAPSDVLICDLAMPLMDGFQLLKNIRERDALTGRLTPAIALTAHATEDHQAKTRAAGFHSHISKPYDVEDLLRTVVAAVERLELARWQ